MTVDCGVDPVHRLLFHRFAYLVDMVDVAEIIIVVLVVTTILVLVSLLSVNWLVPSIHLSPDRRCEFDGRDRHEANGPDQDQARRFHVTLPPSSSGVDYSRYCHRQSSPYVEFACGVESSCFESYRIASWHYSLSECDSRIVTHSLHRRRMSCCYQVDYC